jgi:hypothetical protein
MKRSASGVIVVLKYWEIIADNLNKAGWSLSRVPAIDSQGRMIGIADAHRDNGKRLIVRTDEKLTVFLELEAAASYPTTPVNSVHWQKITMSKLRLTTERYRSF